MVKDLIHFGLCSTFMSHTQSQRGKPGPPGAPRAWGIPVKVASGV